MKSIDLSAGNILVATGNPGMAMVADGSGEQFHLSKDRPMVVFDPEGPWCDIETSSYLLPINSCPVCDEPEHLRWFGGPTLPGLYLHECLGCGTVFSPQDDVR